MDQQFVLRVLETMAQMLEILVARIELTERRLNEACSCKQWASNIRPDATTATKVSDISEIMPQG